MVAADPPSPRPLPDPLSRFVWLTLAAVSLLAALVTGAAMWLREPPKGEDWTSLLFVAGIVGALIWAAVFAARAWSLQSANRAARWVRMSTTAALLWALPGFAGGIAFLGPSLETTLTALAIALVLPVVHPFGWPAVLVSVALTASMERRKRALARA